MIQNQLKELPSVSEVLLKCERSKSLNRKYLSYIIKLELKSYRRDAKKGRLEINRNKIIKNILIELN